MSFLEIFPLYVYAECSHECCIYLDYSRNLCDLKWSWDQRLESVSAKYGDDFKCTLPGVVSTLERSLPICTEYYENQAVLESINSPPIGIHKKVKSGKPNGMGRLSTIDLLEITSLDKLLSTVLIFPLQ